MSWVLILLLLAAVPGAAQTERGPSPQEAAKWPIESLAVDGNENYTEEQILSVAGLRLGQQAGRDTFEAARERLLAAGAFESVGFRYAPSAGGAGYTVTFEVLEIEQIYPIHFENIPAPERELREWLKQKDPLYAERVPGTKELMQRYSLAIEEFLEKQSKKQKIMGSLTADMPDELYIMFHPAGALPVIAEVEFTGNEVIPAGMLREAIHGVAVGSRYTERRFRQLLDASIRPLYEARGRVRVSFPEIQSQPAPRDVNGLLITVHVDEGDSYDVGEVRVEGTLSMNRQLLEVADLKSGDIANFTEVEAALQRINARMRKEGYMQVASWAEREVDEAAKIVNLVLSVEPGPQFVFGKLFIQGLDLDGEAEMKRIWGIDEGQPFDANYPGYFLQRVQEEEIFDNLEKTRSEVKVDEKTLRVDVTLIFN